MRRHRQSSTTKEAPALQAQHHKVLPVRRPGKSPASQPGFSLSMRIYARRDNARKTVMPSQHIRPITVANIVSIALNEMAYIIGWYSAVNI